MEWLGAMNNAVTYLEDHMTEKFEIEEVAKIALSSTFHFQRMFHMITGVTISEYVRRRRLTLAAQEIMSGEKVIDVAYKFGYETPEAFTKAFKKMHGITPSAARASGAELQAYPMISFQIAIKGAKKMNYKIVEKKSFKVVGKKRRITTTQGANFEQVPKFWYDCQKDGTFDWLSSKAGSMGLMGVSLNLQNFNSGFDYMVAVEEVMDKLPKGYETEIIPPATWAIFESVGPLPETLHDLLKRIFAEWMPSTGYQHDCLPEIEVFPQGDMSAADYRCEIWIPVKK